MEEGGGIDREENKIEKNELWKEEKCKFNEHWHP